MIKTQLSRDITDELIFPWLVLQPPQRAAPHYYAVAIDSFDRVISPFLMYKRSGTNVLAMMVGRLERRKLITKFVGISLPSLPSRCIWVVDGGMLRLSPSIDWGSLLVALREEMKEKKIAFVQFRRLRTCSEFYATMRSTWPALWVNESERPNGHWFLDLPSSFDELMARLSRHRRKEFRRYRRVLDRKYIGKIELVWTSDVRKVNALVNRAAKLAATTYQAGLGSAFKANSINLSRILVAARLGTLRAMELQISGKTIAFWIGEFFNGVWYLNWTSFDRQYARYQVGTISLGVCRTFPVAL